MTVVAREFDGAAERFFKSVREEGLAILRDRVLVPSRSRRLRPRRAHVAVETETRLGNMGIQIEPQEIRLLLAQDLLIGLGK